MPDEPVGVKLTFLVDPRQKRNLLSVGLLRKRTLIISYQRPLNLSVWDIQLFIVYFKILHRTNLQRKSEQSDESACIMMIVHITSCEACQRFIVK